LIFMDNGVAAADGPRDDVLKQLSGAGAPEKEES